MPALLCLTLAVLLAGRVIPRAWLGSGAHAIDGIFSPAGRLGRRLARLSRSVGPWVAAVLTAGVTWWVAGGWRVTAYIDDEMAYLLQAHIFAGGHWVGRTPPFPEFFSQMHVLLEPGIMAKYPPLHSALLALGVLVGSERLAPIVLASLAGALVFSLARRLAGSAVACVTLALWLGSSLTLRTFGTYLSESTTSVLVLATWWSVLAIADTGAPWGPPAVAALLALLTVTRPLTGLALTFPLAGLVLTQHWRPTRRAGLLSLVSAGLVLVAMLTVTHVMAGGWFNLPLLRYTRTVLPFDVPGFGVIHPAVAGLPVDQARKSADFLMLHQEHTLANIPGIALERTILLAVDCIRGPLFLLSLLGLILGIALVSAGQHLRPAPARRALRAGRVGLASVGALLGSYLLYAHPSIWTFYYAEVTPVFAFLGALSAVSLLRTPESPTRTRALVVALLAAYAASGVSTMRVVHDLFTLRHGPVADVWSIFELLPGHRVLVFVRYDPARAHNVALVQNTPDVRTAHLVTAYDRGPENERLRRALPDRVAYRYDERAGTIERLAVLTTPMYLRGTQRIVLPVEDAGTHSAAAPQAP